MLKQVKISHLVITRPSLPRSTILYIFNSQYHFFAQISHKDCKTHALQDHRDHITVALHSIYFKTAQHTTY